MKRIYIGVGLISFCLLGIFICLSDDSIKGPFGQVIATVAIFGLPGVLLVISGIRAVKAKKSDLREIDSSLKKMALAGSDAALGQLFSGTEIKGDPNQPAQVLQSSPPDGHKQKDLISIGCPLCYQELGVNPDNSSNKLQCSHCDHLFSLPKIEEIARKRENTPPYTWIILKVDGKKLGFTGIDNIKEGISKGAIMPCDRVLTQYLAPAVSAREIVSSEKKLKKLYDPLTPFADLCSMGLVAIVPAILLFLLGSTNELNVGIFLGISWIALVLLIIVALILFGLITFLIQIPLIGKIGAVILVISTAGTALGVYLVLALVGLVGTAVLEALAKAIRPISMKIGRKLNIEKDRIPNWKQWMENPSS